MEIPDSLIIGGRVFKVDKNKEKLCKDFGYCNIGTQTITILSDKVPQDGQDETLLHEIFEAIKAQNDLSMAHQDLQVLSCALYTTLKANKLDFSK